MAKEYELPFTATEIEQKLNKVSELAEEIADLKSQGGQGGILDAQGETVEEALAWLEENGDTNSIYILPNGNIARYKTIETEGGMTEVTERVTGEFLDDTRISTSSGTTKDASGFVTTPFIDISVLPNDFKIKLTGIRWAYNYDTQYDGYAFTLWKNNAHVFSSYLKNSVVTGSYNYTIDVKEVDATNQTSIVEFFSTNGNPLTLFTHVRFSGYGTSNNAIVELIYKKETQGGTETKWVDTGRGLISSDYDDRLIALENDVNGLKVRVNSLENSMTFDNDIPNYVFNEAEEVADKVLSVRNANSFVMALASDLHTNENDSSSVSVLHAGQGMNVINSLTQLDLVALLGDYEIYNFSYGDGDTDNEDARNSFKHAKKCFTDVSKGVPFMMLQGNHDELQSDTTAQARQKYYAYIGANNVGTVTDYDNKFRNYGYRDFDNYRIRVIYLNTADVSNSEVTESYNVSTEQLNWLNNVALNLTDSSWGIIVLSHHPLNWFGMNGLLNALDTYKGKGSGAELIAHFHGHLHNFRAETLGTNKIPTITIPNACLYRNNEYGTASSYGDDIHEKYGDVDANGNQRQFNKTKDTAEDTAFNVVVIDRENRKIHCFNYGAGIHRTITFDGVLTETEKDETDEPIVPDVPTETYTNQIPLSVNADGSAYVGTNGEKGYKVGYRVNSSGVEEAVSGMCCTGYIYYTPNQTIRLKNITMSGTKTPYLVQYYQDKTYYQVQALNTILTDDGNGTWIGSISGFQGYIRITCGVIGNTTILTLDEEIN